MAENSAFWRKVGDFFHSGRSNSNSDDPAPRSELTAVGPIDSVSPFHQSRSMNHVPWWRRGEARLAQQRELATRLVTLADTLQQNFQRQDSRAEELARAIDRIGGVLEHLAHNGQLDRESLNSIATQTETLTRHSAGIQASLARLPDAVLEQAEVIRGVARRVEDASSADVKLADALSQVGRVVETLGQSGQVQADALQRMTESQHESLQRLVRGQTRRLILVAVIIGVMALGSLATTIALIMLQMRSA